MTSIEKSLAALVSLCALAGCPGTVNNDDSARIAYIGLDQVVVRGLALGFAGFNAASSANIPAQSDEGDASGSIGVTGQVDQGSSDNKGMRLEAALNDYSDGPVDDPETTDVQESYDLTYTTSDGAALNLEINLRDIPNGTLSGTLGGDVAMDGDIVGDVTVDLSFDGVIIETSSGGTVREEGSTEVTGTVTAGGTAFDVDTTI